MTSRIDVIGQNGNDGEHYEEMAVSDEQPYQLCPLCNGQGKVSKPPWVAGDVHQWSGSSTCSYTCRVCNGRGIILTKPVVPSYDTSAG